SPFLGQESLMHKNFVAARSQERFPCVLNNLALQPPDSIQIRHRGRKKASKDGDTDRPVDAEGHISSGKETVGSIGTDFEESRFMQAIGQRVAGRLTADKKGGGSDHAGRIQKIESRQIINGSKLSAEGFVLVG